MGETTNISWCDATFNAWWGCTRVSPGCENCYAEQLATVRRKLPVWGVDASRRAMSEEYWRQPAKWNRKAEAEGVRRRVFCSSMADVFELVPDRNRLATEVMHDARARLWPLIESTPWLDWLLLTKRPENILRLTPWGDVWPANVWIGTTAEDQKRTDERVPRLLRIPAAVRFVSYEPALGPVDWRAYLTGCGEGLPTASVEGHAAFTRGIDWLIIGGESGHKARAFSLQWARSALTQCEGSTCRPFLKQLGARVFNEGVGLLDDEDDDAIDIVRVPLKDRKGADLEEWPLNLRVQHFPTPFVRGAA